MSARNSHAAKAARRGARQRPSMASPARGGIGQAAIAEAVHEAVCAVTGTDGAGMCVLYAQAGAATSHVITGDVYDLQAGGVVIYTGDVNADGELALYVDPEGGEYNGIAGGRANNEYHAWFGPRPAGAEPGTVMEVGPDDMVIADLAVRHFERQVTDAGMTWKRGPLPPYFWGTAADISSRLKVNYRPDVATTRLVTDRLKAMGPAPYDVSTIALRRLGRISEDRALKMLSPAGADRYRLLAGGWRTAEVIPGGGVILERAG